MSLAEIKFIKLPTGPTLTTQEEINLKQKNCVDIIFNPIFDRRKTQSFLIEKFIFYFQRRI